MDQPPPYTREELASLLAFYAESGLDFPVAEKSIDRFNTQVAAALPVAVKQKRESAAPAIDAPPPIDSVPVIPDTQAIAMAQAAASNAHDLDALAQAVAGFEACSLSRSARQAVFEGGNRNAELMIVLDAPGREDDAAGLSFQGEQGRLLKAMLAAIGLDRDADVYAGYCTPWHPPGGQAPSTRHLDICKPFIERQITLAAPKMLLLLGNSAAQTFFGPRQTIMHVRGAAHNVEVGGNHLVAFATFEPKFLLSEPSQKRNAWLDLLSLKAHFSGA